MIVVWFICCKASWPKKRIFYMHSAVMVCGRGGGGWEEKRGMIKDCVRRELPLVLGWMSWLIRLVS